MKFLLFLLFILIVCPVQAQIEKAIPHIRQLSNYIVAERFDINNFTIIFTNGYDITLQRSIYNGHEHLRYSKIDLRNYRDNKLSNPFLNINSVDSLYSAFAETFSGKEYERMHKDFIRYVKYLYNKKENKSQSTQTLDDCIKIFSRDFISIYCGVDNKNSLSYFGYRIPNMSFFRKINLCKLQQFEELIRQTVSFKLLVQPPPEGKFIEFQLSLNLSILGNYY